ncbi:hypothetical protein GWK47_039090 [Chionoecetes opilio]|uniref:Uncharacterized protein n=1 Tax=Chionoecetes opilio TaxID=41210 RepID=A0A8J4YD99_CHIOP|nr:hypothetical protein GWK47_039090 [Chionoecetes opilio]
MPAMSPGTNAISVNISGQPLLTVEMPAMINTQPSMPALTTQALPPPPSLSALSAPPLSVLNELPDLSTPPGTPQPALSSKGLDQTNLQVTGLEDKASLCHPASPPLLFGSGLSVETLPDLPPTAATSLSPTLSQGPSLLTMASTHHLEFKGFRNLLGGSEETQDGSGVQESGVLVPELHIPEGSLGLPLLDISLGGTVTIADQTPGGLLTTASQPTLREQLAAAHSPPSISSVLPHSEPPISASSMISLNTGSQDSSSAHKLMDITLGNSNSNSSFSSLLAAATQPLLGATTEGCAGVGGGPGLGESSGGEVGGVGGGVGSCLVGEASGFPTLSNTPPSPPSSPSRLLQSDNQWLNNEVNDFSLSSFLGHFESPIKNNSNSRGPPTPGASQAPFMPSLSSVYNENSVDFTATFAEMKAQVSGSFKQ